MLCKNEVSDKEKAGLFKFVEEVLTSKLHLLQKTNLYVVLACSLVYCHSKVFSLHKVAEGLRKTDSIVHLSLEACDDLGCPTTI